MIKCNICNASFNKRVSFCNHILRKHQLIAKDYYDTYLKTDNEGICKYENCNNSTIFINVEVGYKDCCCLEHTNLYRYGYKSNLNFPETKEKAQKNSHTKEAINKQAKTNLERYGVCAPLQSKKILAKSQQTCLNKYGVDNPYKSDIIREKANQTKLAKYGDSNYNNRDKAKQTCITHFGVESPMQSEEVKQKMQSNSLEKYGTKHPLSSKEIRNKIEQANLIKYGSKSITSTQYFKDKSKETLQLKYGIDNCQQDPDISKRSIAKRVEKAKQFEIDNNCTNLGMLVSIYGQGFLSIKDKLTLYKYGQYTFVANSDIQKIVDYTNNHTRSRIEDDILAFVKSIYFGKVVHDCRQLIKPLELDIYIPEKKVAIEYNSIYYHSQYGKYYHLIKTKKCEEQNIRLIHIFEWDWLNHRNICESIIKDALEIYDETIYAKDCEIKNVNSKDAREFLDNNHIQGKCNSSYKIGLYYEDKLVQLMCLSKAKNNKAVLFRLCTKLNTNVIDGLDTLLNYQLYNLVLNLDRAKFDTSQYTKVGFNIISKSDPSCIYINQQTMYDCGTIKMFYKK